MKSSQYVALFVDEAGLLLEQCQSCLEQLETSSEPELYRELFRLVHTLKGMASTLVDLPYFEDITQLSHSVEALLDLHKEPLVPEHLYLLSDSFQALGELIRNVANPDQSTPVRLESLYGRFQVLAGPDAILASPLYALEDSFELQPLRLDAQERARAEELSQQGLSLYEIRIELMHACLMKSVRALLVLHNLEQQTELLATQPPAALLREGVFENSFSALVASSIDAEALCELAGSVSEIERVQVLSFDTPPEPILPAVAPAAAEVAPVSPEGLNEFELRLLEEAARMKLHAVWLRFGIQRSVQMQSARIALIFRQIEAHGEVIKTNPPVQELEAEHLEDHFEILVITPETADGLRQHLINDADITSWLSLEAQLHGQSQPLPVPPVPPAPEASALRISPAGGEPRDSLPLPTSGELVESERLKSIRLQHLVRVDAQQLQLLSVLAGELLLTRARLNLAGTGSKQLRHELAGLNRITASLQAISMKLQTVTAAHVFHRYPRMIRDLSRSLGKEIHCELSGEEIEISRAYVDDLSSVLLHMIRNAADHGLEAPGERQRLGKPRHGTIRLAACYRESEVLLEVSDDGRGIDVSALKRKALNQGLLTAEELASMSDEDALQLIFSPGLSTSAAATDISGRGVGMDVVRNHIRQVGGRLQVESWPGICTRFTICLPSEFRQVRSLLVRAEQQYFALPFEQVSKIRQGGEESADGALISLHSLSGENARELLRPESVLLQIRNGDAPVWLMADELIGAQDLAVRQLSNGDAEDGEELVRGAAMLGLEDVALYLEPERLLKLAE